MATNFEVYKVQILEIAKRGSLAVCNDKPVSCGEIQCTGCLFKRDEYGCAQGRELFEWLYAEHIEQPKLTKSEREFCEIVARGVLARDKDGHLSLFSIGSEVYKCEGAWMRKTALCNYFNINKDEFKFIKWEDEKPWAIEDLLKLDVIEEVQE